MAFIVLLTSESLAVTYTIPEYRRQSSIYRIFEAYTILAAIPSKFLSNLGSLLQFVMAVPLSLLVFFGDVAGLKMNSSIVGGSDNNVG